jgi:hypothetical protein
MSFAEIFTQKATHFLEQNKQTFYLSQETPGVSFISEEPRTLPPGKYLNIEPDSRDRKRTVVLHIKSYRMFTLANRMIPYD